uniref:pyrroline-5-carboxylate reductase n=1 Tax=Megasphaera micronuciformis TaxID=187326 RepID=UPI003FF0E990
MFKTVAILGIGNMGRAIAEGIGRSPDMKNGDIILYNPHAHKAEVVAANLGNCARIASTPGEAVKEADLVIIAVKPKIIASLLEEIKGNLKQDDILLSVAAGVTLEKIESVVGAGRKLVRAMPNTPAAVGAGMTSLTPNEHVSAEEILQIEELFSSFGRAEVVDEYLIDAVIGVSGSSPAYVYMFIEALADGAVASGMPRDKAYVFAAQTVMGAAKTVLETGEHPGKLKDDVCSPGGTTIAAVRALEERGFRSAVMEAVMTAAEKSQEMSKK